MPHDLASDQVRAHLQFQSSLVTRAWNSVMGSIHTLMETSVALYKHRPTVCPFTFESSWRWRNQMVDVIPAEQQRGLWSRLSPWYICRHNHWTLSLHAPLHWTCSVCRPAFVECKFMTWACRLQDRHWQLHVSFSNELSYVRVRMYTHIAYNVSNKLQVKFAQLDQLAQKPLLTKPPCWIIKQT